MCAKCPATAAVLGFSFVGVGVLVLETVGSGVASCIWNKRVVVRTSGMRVRCIRNGGGCIMRGGVVEGGVVEGVGVVLSTRRLQRKSSMVHIKGPAQDEHAADEDDGANNFFGE